MRRIIRGGRYYRVCDPSWIDPSDTDFSKSKGGRWNPPGEFGALYLNRSLNAALANAHRHVESLFGETATLYDFLPEALPDLQRYDVTERSFVDIVTPKGIESAKLSAEYPGNVTHDACQRIARGAYAANEAGVAAKSARASKEEELAIFDREVTALAIKREREPFSVWSVRT